MKRFILILVNLVLILVAFQSICWGEAQKDNYKFSKDIITKQLDVKYKELFLDDDIYRNALSSLNDVRITNEKGDNVPYYITNSYIIDQVKNIEYTTKIIKQFKKNLDSYYDFEIENINKNTDPIVNNLRFSVDGANFAKTATILGSYDNINWIEICSQGIYRVDNVYKTDIKFEGEQKYLYYRIKIPNSLEPMVILKMDPIFIKRDQLQENYQKKVSLKYEVTNLNKETLIKIYNKDRLKLKSIKIDADGNFKRTYSVYKNSTEPLNSVGIWGELSNLIFKDLKINNTEIDFASNPIFSDIIIIKIDNRDDAPLKILKVEADYYLDKLVFENSNNSKYKLIFGNEKAVKPNYDIELYKENIEIEKHDLGVLTNFYNIPLEQKSTQYIGIIEKNSRNIFNILIVIISIVLVVIISKKMKKQTD